MSSMQWDTPAAYPAVFEELLVPGFFTAFAEELLDRVRPVAGERLLDVASGTGIVVRRARARCPELTRIVGLDLMPGMLAVAREKSEGLDVELVEGDAMALPFDDGSFDVVTCQQGLQFFPDREQALRELRRVLVPGGRAVVACWAELETSPSHHALVGAVRRHFPDREGLARAPYALPSDEVLRGLLVSAGFEAVGVERVQGVARFATPAEFARSFMAGSPMAVSMAEVPQELQDALAQDIADTVGELFGSPMVAPMATHIATARA